MASKKTYLWLKEIEPKERWLCFGGANSVALLGFTGAYLTGFAPFYFALVPSLIAYLVSMIVLAKRHWSPLCPQTRPARLMLSLGTIFSLGLLLALGAISLFGPILKIISTKGSAQLLSQFLAFTLFSNLLPLILFLLAFLLIAMFAASFWLPKGIVKFSSIVMLFPAFAGALLLVLYGISRMTGGIFD